MAGENGGNFTEEKTELLPKNTVRHEQEYKLTENSFVIRSASLFFNEYLRRSETICHFHAKAIARRRKGWFHFRMSGMISGRIIGGRHCA